MPVAALGYVIGSLAAMGMPGLSGFPAEMQIFMGMWQAAQKLHPGGGLQWWYAPLAAAGVLIIVINAAWMLRVGAKMYFSEPTTPAWQKLPPLEGKEKFAIGLMSVVLLFVGILPYPLMSVIDSTVQAIVKAMGS
jgi:NADH-quinone oxidoreductase subunit M